MSTQPPGGVDDGVLKLERFVGLLATVLEQVQDGTSSIENEVKDLDELEDEAEGKLDSLDDALEDFAEALAAAQDDAVSEIQGLGSLARDAADARLNEADSEIDQAESESHSESTRAGQDLKEAASALSDDGFEALGSKLETVQSELEGAGDEVDSAFDDLEAAAADFEQRGEAALGEAGAKFDEAIAELAEHATAVETDASDCVQAFETAAADSESQSEAKEKELDALYAGWEGDIEAEAQEMDQEVSDLVDESVTFVDTAAEDQIDAPTDTVLDDSFEPYLSELATLQATLEAAVGACAELGTLVDELEKCESVVETIDRLMNAVE